MDMNVYMDVCIARTYVDIHMHVSLDIRGVTQLCSVTFGVVQDARERISKIKF